MKTYSTLITEAVVFPHDGPDPLETLKGIRVRVLDEGGGRFLEVEGDDDQFTSVIRFDAGELEAVALVGAFLMAQKAPVDVHEDEEPHEASEAASEGFLGRLAAILGR